MTNKPFVKLVVKSNQFCLVAFENGREVKRTVGSHEADLSGQARHLATLDYALGLINPVWRGKPTVVVITVRDKNVMRLLRNEMQAHKLSSLLSEVQAKTKKLAVHYED